tara:strand:+ start:2964 stop:3212 length:249 start_codon:yes stop_codon:yes gene_type:complete
MILYSVDWCPECILVKRKLAALGIAYDEVKVSDSHVERIQVKKVSNQTYVPVLTEGEAILTETPDILDYLDKTYGKSNPVSS